MNKRRFDRRAFLRSALTSSAATGGIPKLPQRPGVPGAPSDAQPIRVTPIAPPENPAHTRN